MFALLYDSASASDQTPDADGRVGTRRNPIYPPARLGIYTTRQTAEVES